MGKYRDIEKRNRCARAFWERNKERINAKRRERYATDLEYAEKRREWKKEWNKKHPDKKRKTHLAEYGMTPDDYNKMFEAQEGRCAICGVSQVELKRRLAIDHDHISGKIRGLLCERCNLMLGKANDDINILTSAIQYLAGGI